MKKIQLNETFSGEVSLLTDSSFCESADFSSLIDGTNIIGLVEGQFFQPDGMSRNKRWYSRQLWENVLACADVKNRLASRTMYGEIGHSDGPVTDMTLRSGDVSHIIADLWIDEKGRGMGRAYILDTPKGRLLKTYLGAKSKLKVSTRGEGVYLDGQFHDGCPIIDPDTYELQTVDFVLNPGFMETSAKLTTAEDVTNKSNSKVEMAAQREDYTPTNKEQANNKEATKEGELRMDMDKYVAKLEAELQEFKSENKTLREALQSKEKELLQSQFTESAEMKKINKAFAPFKKMGVSANAISETLKTSQNSLKKAIAKNAKLTEELKAYQDKCGTLEQVDEALEISDKALNTIAEYQKLGSVSELKELVAKSEALVPKLRQLSVLTEYRKLGSVKDLKSLVEKCEKTLPKIKELSILEDYKKLGTVKEIQDFSRKCESVLPKLRKLSTLGAYEKLGTVKDIKTMAENAEKAISGLKLLSEYKKLGTVDEIRTLSKKCESLIPQIAQLKDAKRLAENVKRIIPRLKEAKRIEETAKKAHAVIEQYLSTVGSIKQAKSLTESRKETIKKVNVREALELSKKYNIVVESAAKLIKKYGTEKANSLLESEVAKRRKGTVNNKPSKVITESKKLIEDAGEMDNLKVNVKPETKTAADYLKTGMIVNGFNPEALGKPINFKAELDELDGLKVEGVNKAKELLAKLNIAKDAEVEKINVKVDENPENTPEEAEKLVKDLLK